ncbi:DUF2330 domain-containing protein [Catenulispora subtropica]|uniref:DUF2330 domain-containing protein n=1 Tax=Catenulispora subtropica TaxID=450798 RepID=UPI0031DECCA6
MADPAWACGCGAYIPGANGTASVAREQAVVRFDGTTEDVVMRFSVHSDAPDAAWVMPVPGPGPAKTTLGDKDLFDQLSTAQEPLVKVHHYFLPHLSESGAKSGAGAPDNVGGPMAAAPTGAPVRVLSDQRIGAFEVANLASADPKALGEWLEQHSFTLKAATAERLAAYTAQGWQFVAVRLASGSSADLDGVLDPIRISFPAKDAVYPMRLSAGATTPQHVELSVLAPHRMEIAQAPIAAHAAPSAFGDWIDPSRTGPALANLAAGRMFLTVFDDAFEQPSQITQDYGFSPARSDWVQHPVTYKEELLTFLGIPAYLLVVLALTGIGVVTVVRRGRRSVRRGRGAAHLAG